jgi:hypothetical protein
MCSINSSGGVNTSASTAACLPERSVTARYPRPQETGGDETAGFTS